MLSPGDVKDMAKQVGIPATTVIVMMFLLQFGVIPNDLSKAYEIVRQNNSKIDEQASVVNLIVRQHGEQMITLTKALKEICLNTAKNEERYRECAKLSSDTHERQ